MNGTPTGGRGGDLSAATRPVCIGPANCEAVTGMPWRHVRDHAAGLGLRLVEVGSKRVILAEELLAALRGNAPSPADVADLDLERARREIGRAG
jgi:hypothetical protein